MRDKEIIKKAVAAGVDFQKLSDEEIEAAYEGYQQKLEDLGNLIIVSLRKALTADSTPFNFALDRISREETFEKILGGGHK